MTEELIWEPEAVQTSLSEWSGTLVFLALDPFMAWPMLGLCDPRQALVICWDDGPAADTFRDNGIEVLALGQDLAGQRSTDKLLQAPKARARILQAVGNGPTALLAFKPSARLQSQINSFGFDSNQLKLLASPSNISRGFENKLKFADKIKGYDAPFPKHELVVPAELDSLEDLFARIGQPFIAQFGAGFSGAGTALIHNQGEWDAFTSRRPTRQIRVTRKICGKALTINACISRDQQQTKIWVGQPMEQLTGWTELTPHELGSCGNIWNPEWLSAEVRERLEKVTTEVGQALADEGFTGHFGIDAIVDATDYIYTIETNPRLTANTPVDTLISRLAGQASLFARHILAHLGLPQPAMKPTSTHPNVSQWIIRSTDSDCETTSRPWTELCMASRSASAQSAKPDLGLNSGKANCCFLLRTSPNRELKCGSELGRLIFKGEVSDIDRPGWLKIVCEEARQFKPQPTE